MALSQLSSFTPRYTNTDKAALQKPCGSLLSNIVSPEATVVKYQPPHFAEPQLLRTLPSNWWITSSHGSMSEGLRNTMAFFKGAVAGIRVPKSYCTPTTIPGFSSTMQRSSWYSCCATSASTITKPQEPTEFWVSVLKASGVSA